MSTIRANVSRMFESVEPCYVSASQSELGDAAGQITWRNALEIVRKADRWLLSPGCEAVDGMREWAGESGGWASDEIADWTDEECLALFVQNLASELRLCLTVDENGVEAVVDVYESTDWEQESEYPTGSYSYNKDDVGQECVIVDYYTGI